MVMIMSTITITMRGHEGHEAMGLLSWSGQESSI